MVGSVGAVFAVDRLGLPVVVVVMQHQLEGLAAVAAARIRLFHGQLRAMQHAQSEHLLRTVLDGPEKPDAHLASGPSAPECRARRRYRYSDGCSSSRKALRISNRDSGRSARPHTAQRPDPSAVPADALRTHKCC